MFIVPEFVLNPGLSSTNTIKELTLSCCIVGLSTMSSLGLSIIIICGCDVNPRICIDWRFDLYKSTIEQLKPKTI